MPFPSSSGSRSFTLAAALSLAQLTADAVKSRSQTLSAACGLGNVPASSILVYLAYLADAKANFTKSAAAPGLAVYAQEQIGDTDIANEFNAMVSAVDTVRNWILTNFPKDGSGNLLYTQFTADNSGRTQQTFFTIGQVSGLKALLDSLVLSID